MAVNLHPGPLTPHGHGFSTWHAYDPACKAELWSTCFTSDQGTVLFDPIDWPKDSPLPPPPVWIVRTNENHDRACAELTAKTKGQMASTLPGFNSIPLPSAGEGETAFFHPLSGTLVVGDALINLAPHGLMLLPDKYCTDPAQLKTSLRRLLDLPIQRIFFAHGNPINSSAQALLRPLLS
jgi:glyoxylase-like metal-dependent hydrolase (beta-lactamase superfamily II)